MAFAFWVATQGARNDAWREAMENHGRDMNHPRIEPLEPTPSASGVPYIPPAKEDEYTKRKMMKELWEAMGEDAVLFTHLYNDMGAKKFWKLMLKVVGDYGTD